MFISPNDLQGVLETENNLDRLRRGIFGDKENRFIKNNLREIRTSNGLSQQQLAKDLSMTQAQIHKIENCQGNFTVENLIVCCRFFNCSIDDMLDVELPNAETSFAYKQRIKELEKKISDIKMLLER